MGLSEAQGQVTAQRPRTIIDISGQSAILGVNGRPPLEALTRTDFDVAGDIDAALDNLDKVYRRKSPTGDVVIVVPSRLVRTRRVSFSLEIRRAVSNADFDQLTQAAAAPEADAEGYASLYRLPVTFLLDHKVSATPPFGQAGEIFTAEFLDLSAKLADLTRLEKLTKAAGCELIDVLTPHEVLACRVAKERPSGVAVHVEQRDMVVCVVQDGGMTGAGALAAGKAHLASDLVAADMEDAKAAPGVAMDVLADNTYADDPRWPVLEARLDEFASFAHQVCSTSHAPKRVKIMLSGFGDEAPGALAPFKRLCPEAEFELVDDEAVDHKGLIAAAREALSVPRITVLADDSGKPAQRLFRWISKHI